MKKPFSLRQASARWWVLLAALGVGSVAAYLGGGRQRPAARFEGRTMGTTYSVVLGGPRPPSAVAALQREVEALLVRINGSMSTYDPVSELSRFNQHQATTPVELSAPLAEVLALSLEVYRASEGSFDVTVGPLVDAWGFGPAGRAAKVPTDGEVAALLLSVGSDKLRLEGRALSKLHPLVRIDLSAVAKGDGVDSVSDLLLRLGEADHLVEIGGELRARGKNAQGEPFRVGAVRTKAIAERPCGGRAERRSR